MASSQVPVKFSEKRLMESVTIEVIVVPDLGWRRIGFLFIKIGAWIIGADSSYEVDTKDPPGIDPRIADQTSEDDQEPPNSAAATG